MKRQNKLLQLQIRVSPTEKAAICAAAKHVNMSISEWILTQILPANLRRFQDLVMQLKQNANISYVFAELHDLFHASQPKEFERMVSQPMMVNLTPYLENYLAAMIEYAANQKGIPAPNWVNNIKPLDKPVFGSDLLNLRLYLLTHSPPPFRSRNIFIDSTIGKRV